MSTDKTWFDGKLKRNLYLDISLRISIWLVIALSTIAYASSELGFSPLSPLQKSMSHLMPVIVDVMRVSIVLCLAALLLKDLESVAPASWGQQTSIGKFGGVVRRIAGDLSLWIIGALTTVLASLLYFSHFAYTHNAWSSQVAGFSITITIVMVTSIAVLSWVSVWVRRDVSFISSHKKLLQTFDSPWKVVAFYATLVAVIAITK